MQKINLVVCFNFFIEGLFIYTFLSCYLKKIIKVGFPELEKKVLQRFCSFFPKKDLLICIKVKAVPNGLRIEHLCDIFPKAQSWLVLNFPGFMFVYILFNVPVQNGRMVGWLQW